jgi:predicted ATP-grasp superfamily ATP-dependent carboligase
MGGMALYAPASHPAMSRPAMVLALSGWVDAASIATDAAEFIADAGEQIGSFDSDRLFDYRSSRPILHFRGGELEDVVWPQLRVFHAGFQDGDVLVVHGNEPDFLWHRLSEEFVDLVRSFDVRLLLTLGAVPAMVPHTRPSIEVVTTASDQRLLLDDDVTLQEELIVPGAAVSILSDAVRRAGIATIGYYARAPHYLNRPFHAGVLALLDRVARQAGVHLDVADLKAQAVAQREDLDRISAARPEVREYIERLEGAGELTSLGLAEDLPSADELAAEVERYLRQASDDD